MFNSNSDPFVNALKEVGYNMVRLPRANIQPLQVLAKNGDNLELLGNMTTLLTGGGNIPVPIVGRDTPTTSINGKCTSDLKIGLGLSILGNIIGALGGSKLGLDVQYNRAKSAVFEFQDVLQDSIEILSLDQYLGDADINPASVHVNKLLEADQLYVITSTIKSKKFIFEAKTDKTTSLGVDVPVIQQTVGANLKVSTVGGSNTKIAYEAKESAPALVFGFQAIQVFYQDGRYQAFKPINNSMAMRGLEDEDEKPKPTKLIANNTLIRLTDLT